MEKIEKLPILKTALAANREFFKQFFNIKVFLTFMLPIAVILGADDYISSKFIGAQGEIEMVQHLKNSEMFFIGLSIIFSFSIMLLGWFSSFRYMVLCDPLTLSLKKKFKLFRNFILKYIWLFFVGILYALPAILFVFLLLVGFLAHMMDSPEEIERAGNFYIYLAAISAPLSIYFTFWFLMKVTCICLTLSASASGTLLNVREALNLSRYFRWRFLFIYGISLVLPFLFYAYLLGVSPIILGEVSYGLYFNYLLIGFILVWIMCVSCFVLSMFYMHYIVPQLPEIEEKRAEKLVMKMLEKEKETVSE